MAWWEFAIPFFVSLILILIFKFTSETMLTSDTEYLGSYITRVEYYEDWNEYITRICSRSVPCGSDSKGNTRYCTEMYDCSYVDYHPEEYHAIDNTGGDFRISERQYNAFVAKFEKPYFSDLRRSYYTNDGDMWTSEWDGNYKSYEFVATQQHYVNKVQAVPSVYTFPKVSKTDIKQYGLQEYPDIVDWYKLPALLADSGYVIQPGVQKKLNWLNGNLGAKKQVRVWCVIFRNRSRESGMLQEALWKGSNKNEFNIFISVDDKNQVQWCQVSTWCEVEILKIEVRNYVESMKTLDMKSLADYLYKELDEKFVRKQFAEFNYLTVEPSTSIVLWTFIITLLVNIAVSFWLVKNEFTEEEIRGSSYY